MKNNKIVGLYLILIIIPFLSCEENVRNDPQNNLELVGCWKGGLVQNNELVGRDLQLRMLSLRPDSTLALTAIYELGPRSRVWEYDTEIYSRGDRISWLAHQGYLSENGDTMYITKIWKGEKTQWMFFRDRSSDQFMTQFMSSNNTKYKYKIPDENSDGWICEDLRKVGIDEMKITKLINQINKGKHGDIHSILICRNGKLVLEEYFALNGRISSSFTKEVFRNKVHHLSSTTKCVFSALCGIAIDQGLIVDVDQPIYKYLPQYLTLFTEESKLIKVKDMLTMRAGWEWEQFKYDWQDPRNDAAEMYKCGDVIKYVLERPIVSEPGKKFNYSNGVPTVMGAVLKNACGMEVDDYADKSFFQPLGISDYLWTRYPDGSLETDGGLALRSRDLVKIGQLFLNNGYWRGNQIISKNWIRESTKSRVSLSLNRGFGYYWNEKKLDPTWLTERAYFAPGDGGQFVAIFPVIDMVIVVTAGNYNSDPASVYWNLFEDAILPALKFEDI